MKAIVDSEIKITGAPPDMVAGIKGALQVPNPVIKQKKKLGLPTWYDPETLPVYRCDGRTLIIPRGMALWLHRHYPAIIMYGRRLTVDPVVYRSTITPRAYQQQAIAAIRKRTQGVVVMPCGSGKTETALQAVAEIGQPALWLTHTLDLMNQSLSRAQSRMGLQEGQWGVIGDGQSTIGTHITFATVQTLAQRDLSEIVNRFGTVIVDECHHCFANPQQTAMFESVIRQLPAKYRIGLTATDHRSDGLLKTMYMVLGPCIYRLHQADLSRMGYTVTPTVYMMETPFTADIPTEPHIDFGKLLLAMVTDQERNERIVSDLRALLGCGRRVIVLGSRVAHLQELMGMLDDPGTRHISSKVAAKARAKALDDMRDDKARILFASYNLAREGLDLPRVDTLVLVTPQKDRAIIQQAVGRIMRPAPDKQSALVIDYVDSAMPVCYWQAKTRNDLYKDLGCPVNGWAPKNRKGNIA